MKQEIEIKCAYTDMVATDEVTPHPKNPNKHPPKQVALLARIARRNGVTLYTHTRKNKANPLSIRFSGHAPKRSERPKNKG